MRLVFGKRGHDVNRETIRVRHIAGDKVDVALHQATDEIHIACESIEFRDQQRRAAGASSP